MKADTRQLEHLFHPEIRYLVPMYQRPYVWKREDQWEPLWGDVRNLAEAWLLDSAAGEDPGVSIGPHFLGAVVLEQEPHKAGFVQRRLIIDGQQRLTTLQILLDAAQEVMAEHADKKDSQRMQKLILNDELYIEHSDEVYKVWPTNVDRDAFRAAMDDAADPSPWADSRIVKAHRYFSAEIEHWATDMEDKVVSGFAADERLRALGSVLMSKIHLVVIDLDPEDSAQSIFETLNARGTPLLASDLVKNYLLRRVDKDGDDVEAIYNDYLREFDTNHWRSEVRQGRFKRPRVDVFLFHWLGLRLRRVMTVGQEFKDFRTYLSDSGVTARAVAGDIFRVGQIFRSFDAIDFHTLEGQFHYRLRILDAGAVNPLLLLLYADGSELSTADRLPALQAIESFLVRRTICGETTRSYSRFVAELLSDLGALPAAELPGALVERLAGETALASRWPTDDEVKVAVKNSPLYLTMTRARLRMIFEAIEDHLRTEKTEPGFSRSKLTIEHLMPQGWTDEVWPLPDRPSAEERRAELIHTMGNLTLVTGKLNPSLSNGSWQNKRSGLSSHSVLRLNHELLDRYSEWDEDSIDERSAELGDVVTAIWPRR